MKPARMESSVSRLKGKLERKKVGKKGEKPTQQ